MSDSGRQTTASQSFWACWLLSFFFYRCFALSIVRKVRQRYRILVAAHLWCCFSRRATFDVSLDISGRDRGTPRSLGELAFAIRLSRAGRCSFTPGFTPPAFSGCPGAGLSQRASHTASCPGCDRSLPASRADMGLCIRTPGPDATWSIRRVRTLK